MVRTQQKRHHRGVIRSLLILALTLVILFTALPKHQETNRFILSLAILNLMVRIVMMCVLFNYSDILLKIGVFLYTYAQIFGTGFIIFSNAIVHVTGMILEMVGISMIALSLFLLSKNVSGDQLFRLAFSDSLTGLMNRQAFLNQTRRILKVLNERNRTAAMIYIDLNKFKFVNDRYGHHTGDRVLETVGKRIKSIVRRGDLVARFGGDEFVFFLPDSNEETAKEVVKRIIDRITLPILVNGVQFCLGMSAGIAIFPKDGKTAEELIMNADKAMYEAKNAQNSYVFSSQTEEI